jgi:hypothetical protein
VVATGVGLDNEYVLIKSSGPSSDCSSASGGEAYELSGKAEADLKPFIGKRVEIQGMLKNEAVGTSGQPSGGFDPLKQDLRLPEVDVMSFREAPASTQTNAQPSQTAPAAATPEPREPETAGTTGVAQQPSEPQTANQPAAEELPGTASPLPLAGLLGLLSLAGALGARRMR